MKSATRWRTRSRLSLSAASVDRGRASSDWQILSAAHAVRAEELSFPTCHSRLTSGMLATKIAAPGSPVVSVCIVVRNLDSKSATEVMLDSDDVQASLAPIRIVT